MPLSLPQLSPPLLPFPCSQATRRPRPQQGFSFFLQETKGRGQTSWHLGLWVPRRWWLLSWPKRSAATRRLLEVEPTFWGKFRGESRCPRGWHSAAGKAAGRREQEPPWMDSPITPCACKAPLHLLTSPGCFRGRVSLPPPLHQRLPKRKRGEKKKKKKQEKAVIRHVSAARRPAQPCAGGATCPPCAKPAPQHAAGSRGTPGHPGGTGSPAAPGREPGSAPSSWLSTQLPCPGDSPKAGCEGCPARLGVLRGHRGSQPPGCCR